MIQPYIVTYSGRKFYPLKPNVLDVRLIDVAHALSNACRWSGHVKEFYSVAQHAVWVANWVSETHPELALAALHHDSHEAYLHDVPSPLKSFLELNGKPYAETEKKLDLAIQWAFGIDPLTEAEVAVVKDADLKALKFEQQHLMASWPLDDTLTKWPIVDAPAPVALPPDEARHAFMAAHNKYRRLP